MEQVDFRKGRELNEHIFTLQNNVETVSGGSKTQQCNPLLQKFTPHHKKV
uniref:Uncharacterized protein n=1 Tax=Arion vulgaris TaxID=1028688 RepID=A0A0B6Y2C2_9EUPU